MLNRLNCTNNFVARSGKHCTILKLQLGVTLKQTLVNAQHSLCVLCIFESTKIDVLFVCMLRSRQLSYEPVPPFLCLFIFHTLMHLYQPTRPGFSFARAPRLSLSLFLPPTLLQTLPFLHDRFHSYLYSVFYFHSVPLIRPDFSPLYTFFNAHFRLYGHFPALLFVSSFASSPSSTFVPLFSPPPPLSFLSFPSESNFLMLSSFIYLGYV